MQIYKKISKKYLWLLFQDYKNYPSILEAKILKKSIFNDLKTKLLLNH